MDAVGDAARVWTGHVWPSSFGAVDHLLDRNLKDRREGVLKAASHRKWLCWTHNWVSSGLAK